MFIDVYSKGGNTGGKKERKKLLRETLSSTIDSFNDIDSIKITLIAPDNTAPSESEDNISY
jgi:hypothetical protein